MAHFLQNIGQPHGSPSYSMGCSSHQVHLLNSDTNEPFDTVSFVLPDVDTLEYDSCRDNFLVLFLVLLLFIRCLVGDDDAGADVLRCNLSLVVGRLGNDFEDNIGDLDDPVGGLPCNDNDNVGFPPPPVEEDFLGDRIGL